MAGKVVRLNLTCCYQVHFLLSSQFSSDERWKTFHLLDSLFFPSADSGDVSSIKDVATLELLADVRPTHSSWIHKCYHALHSSFCFWKVKLKNKKQLTSESELSSSARLGAFRSFFLWGTDWDPEGSTLGERDPLVRDRELDVLLPMYGLNSSAQSHAGGSHSTGRESRSNGSRPASSCAPLHPHWVLRRIFKLVFSSFLLPPPPFMKWQPDPSEWKDGI